MMLYGNYTIKYMKEETYRPLPSSLTIKRSGVDGLGLFANEYIEAETYLGITHIFLYIEAEWIRTPLGGFINHSSDPNCSITYKDNEYGRSKRMLYTEEDIAPGEELLVYYSLDEYKDKISNFK